MSDSKNLRSFLRSLGEGGREGGREGVDMTILKHYCMIKRSVGPEGALPLLRLGELLSNVCTHFLKVTISLLGLVGSGGERKERGERGN